MNWKWKSHVLALLSRLPGGRSAYHRLQRLAGTNRLDIQEELSRAFELVELTREAGGDLLGAECLEIGTGWRPMVPFVLALGGVRHVRTIDVNPWLTTEYAWEGWQALEPHLSAIATTCGSSLKEVEERYRRIGTEPKRLGDLLDPLGIEYIYPGDARAVDAASGSFDLVVSSNVLEHIPYEVQQEIHQESFRLLKPGGLAVHRFNPQDHYSTVDSSITHANFLRFSEQEWKWYGGSGLAYHNRLRAPQYRDLFESAGFDLAICRERLDARTLEALKEGRLPVHADLNGFSHEELAVDYMWVVGRRPLVAAQAAVAGTPDHQTHETTIAKR